MVSRSRWANALELAELVEVDEVVEHEGDVVEGRSVVSHRGQTVDRRARRYAATARHD